MQTKPVNVVRFSDDISPKKTPLDVKLDLTKDLLIREHWAYFRGNLFYALDMHGVLAHEVLAIDSYLREGSMIFVFDGERWEKKLLVENVSIVNCAVDSKSNLYFMAEQEIGYKRVMSDVAFPSRKRREVQRILLSPTGEIIKNDVYKVEKKELLEITKLLKHNGKLYIFSLWECNKKERAIHEEKARLGELPGRLLPIEELDVYDIGKLTSTMKTKLTIIEAK